MQKALAKPTPYFAKELIFPTAFCAVVFLKFLYKLAEHKNVK